MVSCIHCGFCGYHINHGRGLKWEELSTETRRAFADGEEYNPPGQTPGTGQWNFLRCLNNLHEWQTYHQPMNDKQDIQNSLTKQRNCNGYFKYHAGFSAPQHHDLQMRQSGFHLEQWNTRIALAALILAVLSLVISTTHC